MASMVKMQVYLDMNRYRFLKQKAKSLGLSMAELVRSWIDEKTVGSSKHPLKQDPFWKCVGRGDSGQDDIAQHFDDSLYGEKN